MPPRPDLPMFLRALTLLGLSALCIYLFVTAPPPLPDEGEAGAGTTIPMEQAFAVLAAENDEARRLWTQEIVGAGKKVGLSFDEDWEREEVEAGPLPALFLKETARQMQRMSTDLTFFLGSDAPIKEANRFEGQQALEFAEIRATGEPQFFEDTEHQDQVAMFPDVASAAACVSCHNDHVDSPRDDWTLHEVMGATTWTYPAKAVSLQELLQLTEIYRASTRGAYERYLEMAASFEDPPVIGDQWPRDGERVLPSADAFMEAVDRAVSSATVLKLFDLARADR